MLNLSCGRKQEVACMSLVFLAFDLIAAPVVPFSPFSPHSWAFFGLLEAVSSENRGALALSFTISFCPSVYYLFLINLLYAENPAGIILRDNSEHCLHIDTKEGEEQECAAADTEAPNEDHLVAEEENGKAVREARKGDAPILPPRIVSSKAQVFENILKFAVDEKKKISALVSGDCKRKINFEEMVADIQRRGKMFEEDISIMKAKELEIFEKDFNIWTESLGDSLIQSESSSTENGFILQSRTDNSIPRFENEQANGVNQAPLILLEMKSLASNEAEDVNCEGQEEENVFELNKESKTSERQLTDLKVNENLDMGEEHLGTLAENIPIDANVSRAKGSPLYNKQQHIKNLSMDVEYLQVLNSSLDSGDLELFEELLAKPSPTSQINKILDLPGSLLWLFKQLSFSKQELEIVKEDNLHLQQEIARKQAEISVAQLQIDDKGFSSSEEITGYRAEKLELECELKLLYDQHHESFVKFRTARDDLTREKHMMDKLVDDSLKEYNEKLKTFRYQQGLWKETLAKMESRVSNISSFVEMKFRAMESRLTACAKELQAERSNFEAFRSKWNKQVDGYCELMEESIALETKVLMLEEKENMLKMRVLEEENLEAKLGNYETMVKEMVKMMNAEKLTAEIE
ncbi:hypothetical protein AXF42_Ash021010 [Apostasia shenzhenica]|uniref:Uncharacterized protein n=1 Tax=Apostasia shenzhenica TaxID=1088818 RepID=A0A2I0AEW8_9ASPA|nr:hypothetical protein AXF42_Ash021010 [Apostasia shenzhenica]